MNRLMNCFNNSLCWLKVQNGPSHRNIQTRVDIDTLFKNCDWLDDIFGNILGDYYKHPSGNFYITTQLHDAPS